MSASKTRLTNTFSWGWKSSLKANSLLSGIFLGGDAVNLFAIGSSVKHAKEMRGIKNATFSFWIYFFIFFILFNENSPLKKHFWRGRFWIEYLNYSTRRKVQGIEYSFHSTQKQYSEKELIVKQKKLFTSICTVFQWKYLELKKVYLTTKAIAL